MWSIVGSLLINVVGLLTNLLPGMGDIPGAVYVVGSVFAALAVLGGWGCGTATDGDTAPRSSSPS